MYYGCCQKRSSHLGAVGWVDVGRLGGQLSLQRSDLASGIQTHLRGEAGRLYKLVGKGTMSFALCVPIWSISVWNRAENMWILLTDWSKSFASSSSRNWFSIFSPSKWTSHWFFCLILFFGFGNHWLFFFFFDTFKIFFIYFWLHWVFIAVRASLWLRRAGTTLRCGARASHCGGLSCCRAQALGVLTSIVVALSLSNCDVNSP